MEVLEHGGGRVVEGPPRAERIVFVRRAGKQFRAQLLIELVGRYGDVLRHFLLDRSALFIPGLFVVGYPRHPQGFDVKSDVEVLGGNRIQILSEALARIGVEIPAHHAADVRKLVGGKTGTAAEHHVLLRMGQARKARRRFIRTDEIVDRGRHHRRQRIADDDDAQAIGKPGADDIAAPRRGGRSEKRKDQNNQEGKERNTASRDAAHEVFPFALLPSL